MYRKTKMTVLLVVLAAVMLIGLVGCNQSQEKKDAEISAQLESVVNSDIGNTVKFGYYEQDTSSEGKEEIEWLVLDQDGTKFLLFSKNVLDSKLFHTEHTDVTWATASLRTWLNTTFYGEAFEDKHTAIILTSTVVNHDNAQTGIDGGIDTDDKVFILSIDEAVKYFNNDQSRLSNPTKYALSQNVVTNDNQFATWLLRTPGAEQSSVTYVSSDGMISSDGGAVNSKGAGVRPAIWVDISSLELSDAFYQKSVQKVEALINALPDSITNYAIYDEAVMNAHRAYMDLDEAWRSTVSNVAKLQTCMSGFHMYRANLIRATVQEINAESVQKTDVLNRLYKLYSEMTVEQKALLSATELSELESMIVARNVIVGIQNLMNDAVGYYDTLTSIKSWYASLDNAKKALVYNYSDLDHVEDAYALQSNLSFTQTESGGWSVKLKDGASSAISGELIIPSEYKDVPIVAIEDYAFQNCRNITSVYIPETVTTIGVGAFNGCTKIQSMTLPFIGESASASAYRAVFGYIFGYETKQARGDDGAKDAFVNTQYDDVETATWQYSRINYQYSGGLVQSFYYYIPTSVKTVTVTDQTKISDAAFNGCSHIEKIVYEKEIESIGVAAFQDCESLISFNTEKANTIDLTGAVEELGDYCFKNCVKIEEVILDEDISVIGNHAFEGCKSIKQLDLTDNITFIGDYAFKGLKAIKDVLVYDSTTTIGKGAFEGCNSIESITLPFTGRSKDATAYTAVFGYIFGYETKQEKGDDGAKDAFVNTQYESVENAVWQYSRINYQYSGGKVQSFFYYIPKSIRTVTITNQSIVPDAAFNGCTKIESVTYSQTIEAYGTAAFQNCEALKKFNSETSGMAYLVSEAPKIGDYCFKNCKNITEIELYDGLAIVGSYAFEGTSITTLVIPDTVTAINRGALKACNKLTSLTIPFIGQSKTATAYNAVFGFIFDYTTKQEKGDDGAKDAFVNTQYESVENAVWQYSRINYQYSGGKVQSFFYYIPATLKTVTVTDQTVIPTAAFNGCTMIDTITFEQDIESEGEYAFQNCPAEIVR